MTFISSFNVPTLAIAVVCLPSFNNALSFWSMPTTYHLDPSHQKPSSLQIVFNWKMNANRYLKLWTFGWSSIRLWQWMNGVGKLWQILTKVALAMARSRWNRWNIGSSVVHLLNKGDGMLQTSCGNSLPKEGTFVRGNPFLRCNTSLINLCARHWNDSVAFGFSWGVVFHGLFDGNGIIWF